MPSTTRTPRMRGERLLKSQLGILQMDTPLCVPTRDNIMIGRITSIEFNHAEVKKAKKGDEVCVKIDQADYEQKIIFGRHFDFKDKIVSKITRESINLLKANFKDDLKDDDWRLVIKLKKMFVIM